MISHTRFLLSRAQDRCEDFTEEREPSGRRIAAKENLADGIVPYELSNGKLSSFGRTGINLSRSWSKMPVLAALESAIHCPK